MPDVNIVSSLKECVVIARKNLWLIWIDWHLDRYLRVSNRNKRLYWKIQRMALRFNYIFSENLFCDKAKDDE